MKQTCLSQTFALMLALLTSCTTPIVAVPDAVSSDTQPTSTPVPSRTPNATEIYLVTETAYARATDAQHTEQALYIQQVQVESTLYAVQFQATQLSAQQTRVVAETQAAQTAVAAQSTQQSIASTQAAEATETTIAIRILEANMAGTQAASIATAAAESTSFALAARGTQNAIDSRSTADAASLVAQQTAVAAQAKNAEAAAQRTVMTNQFVAWLNALAPILALLGFAGLLYIVGWFWWRVNKAKILHPNAQGAYPMVYDNERLINGQRAFGPVVDPAQLQMPQDETIQGRIAITDTQVGAVRAIAAGNGNPEQTARRVQRVLGGAGQIPGAQPKLPRPFRIIPAERVQQALPPEVIQVIEGQWREVTHDNQPE